MREASLYNSITAINPDTTGPDTGGGTAQVLINSCLICPCGLVVYREVDRPGVGEVNRPSLSECCLPISRTGGAPFFGSSRILLVNKYQPESTCAYLVCLSSGYELVPAVDSEISRDKPIT